MSATVVLVDTAEAQLAEIDRWWRTNRGGAPELFFKELSNLIDLLAAAPDIGAKFPRARMPGVRRVLLRRSKHYAYYVHDARRSIVYILAIWSTSRGSEPDV